MLSPSGSNSSETQGLSAVELDSTASAYISISIHIIQCLLHVDNVLATSHRPNVYLRMALTFVQSLYAANDLVLNKDGTIT